VSTSGERSARTGRRGAGAAAANYVATQVDVIGSHNVALKVVDRLKLAATGIHQEIS